MSMSNRGAPSPPPASRPRKNPPPPPPLLCLELIVEILLWLPVKSLARFKCVSKSWKSLISDPTFIKSHHRRSSTNPHLLLLRRCDGILVSHSLRSLLHNPSSSDAAVAQQHDSFQLKWNRVIGYCNGLVCLQEFGSGNYWIFLWNPATKLRSRKLAYLRTDDVCGPFYFAFGHDILTDTYKVVAYCAIRQTSVVKQQHKVKVCSLGGGASWRDFQGFPITPFAVHLSRHKGLYLSGAVNWLALRDMSVVDLVSYSTTSFDRLAILSLDLGNEKYTQWRLPHGFSEEIHFMPTLGVLRDSLCVCYDYKATDFVIWQMKDFGVDTSWTQLVKLSYANLQIFNLRNDFPLIWMSEKGDVLIMRFAGRVHAILYDLGYNTVEKINLPDYSGMNGYYIQDVFVESLIWPCCN